MKLTIASLFIVRMMRNRIDLVESDTNLPGSYSNSRPQSSGSRRKKVVTFTNENGSRGFFENLFQLRRENFMCDLVLEASDSRENTEAEERQTSAIRIQAHKLVLAAGSPYFRAMFTSNMIESTAEKIPMRVSYWGKKVLQNTDVEGDSLSALVDYMYTGRIDIDESSVQTLLATASLLQLNCVKDACCRFLHDQLEVNNCLGISAFADLHSCTTLAQTARTFAQQHFRELIETDELVSMDEFNFISLISEDHLTTKGEEAVFEAVINWVNRDAVNRVPMLPSCLQCVRLPLLDRSYLSTRVKNEPLIKESSECKDLLIEAYETLLNAGDTTIIQKTRKHWAKQREPVPISQLILMVGGQAPKAIQNVDIFNPDTVQWTPLSNLTTRRCRCGIGMAGDLVYAIGGFNGSARVRTVDVYVPHLDQWKVGPQMDVRRGTLGVTVSDGILYAVGGFDGSTGLASAEMLDPRTGCWQPIPPMSVHRSSVAVTAHDGEIYAVGGYDGMFRQCLHSVEIFDIRADRWRDGPHLNQVRSGAGVTVINDKVIVAGGHEGPNIRNTVEILIDDCWEILPSMNIPRRNAGIVATNGYIYAIGGDDGTSNLGSVERLSVNAITEQCEWELLKTEMAIPRSYAGFCLLPNNYAIPQQYLS